MNKSIFCLGVAVTMVMQLAGPAWSRDMNYSIDKEKSRIDFSFRSTLHKVEGQAHDFQGTFTGRPGLFTYLTKGEVDVDIRSMDTFNPKRNQSMFQMFDSDHFPRMHYQLSEVVGVPAVEGPAGRVLLRGKLTIKDYEQTVEIPAVIQKTPDGLVLSGSVDLSLNDFHLVPPSVMVIIRVFDTVKVNFKATLTEVGT